MGRLAFDLLGSMVPGSGSNNGTERGTSFVYPTAIGWLSEEKSEFGFEQHQAWETVQGARYSKRLLFSFD